LSCLHFKHDRQIRHDPNAPAGALPVTKKEIVRRISDRAHLTQLKTKEIVQWTFDAIIDTLIKDGRIELRNFGVFEVRRRKARRARNPRTNDRVDVPEKNVVTFQPGKEMEERVRREAKVYEPKRKKPKPAANQTTNAKAKPAPAPAPVKTKPAAKGRAKPAPEPAPGTPPAGAPAEQELVVVGAPTETPAPGESTNSV
jgi:nucleoid DNA-binding protein